MCRTQCRSTSGCVRSQREPNDCSPTLNLRRTRRPRTRTVPRHRRLRAPLLDSIAWSRHSGRPLANGCGRRAIGANSAPPSSECPTDGRPRLPDPFRLRGCQHDWSSSGAPVASTPSLPPDGASQHVGCLTRSRYALPGSGLTHWAHPQTVTAALYY